MYRHLKAWYSSGDPGGRHALCDFATALTEGGPAAIYELTSSWYSRGDSLKHQLKEFCHSERSEESAYCPTGILSAAKNDSRQQKTMRITALEPQANNPERYNLYVDGHFLLGVNAAIVLQMGLHIEQELSPEQLEQLNSEEAEQQAVDRALNYLSYRPRSREEVRRYLRRKETPPDIIEAALARLDRLDFVNDRAFASFWIENREQFNPRGSHALKNELRMKGVDRAVVDELVDDEQDEPRALRAGRKKALSLLHLPNMDYPTFRNRLGSFLQRRGFGYEVATRTVKNLWKELKESE